MPREPARNKKPRKEPTNFVARFRFSGQISNRATFRDTERAEAAGSMRPWQENAPKA